MDIGRGPSLGMITNAVDIMSMAMIRTWHARFREANGLVKRMGHTRGLGAELLQRACFLEHASVVEYIKIVASVDLASPQAHTHRCLRDDMRMFSILAISLETHSTATQLNHCGNRFVNGPKMGGSE